MIGLLQELGPCRITNDSSHVTLNNFSWNNEANLLFIDQPVGVGFSHGDTTSVGTSQEAAADVWTFMQILFADPRFSKYQQNNLAIWTESWVWKYFWYIYSIEILFTDMEDTTDRHLLREFFFFFISDIIDVIFTFACNLGTFWLKMPRSPRAQFLVSNWTSKFLALVMALPYVQIPPILCLHLKSN